MEKEIWKAVPIDGLEHYQVSNIGNVRNTSYKGTGKIRNLTPCVGKDGYVLVCLTSKGGKQMNYWLHRLVAMAFVPNPNGYEQVNHLDEAKENNTAENLEWCTCKYNNNYGHRNERISKSKTNKNCKPVCQCDTSGNVIKVWPSINELNRAFGYDTGLIAKRCMGIGSTAYGFKWKYFGECASEEWKNAKSGSEALHKKVIQLDDSGNVIHVWGSIKEAETSGYSGTMISACCHGRRKHTGGYRWEFA
nr:MAG TPA: homing endonuclease [Caudoviricetes sp.]